MKRGAVNMPVNMLAGLFATLLTLPAQAAEPLNPTDASAWLQRMSDAARRATYTGVFVVQNGSGMQTMSIVNRPVGTAKESRLAAMDGIEREIRCSQTGSISRVMQDGQIKIEKRLNSRYFPDLLPPNAAALAAWYNVKLGERSRVAGLECRQVEIVPKDAFRWGYVLCADKETGLPLRAVMVNEAGLPLMPYAFAAISIGNLPRTEANSPAKPGNATWSTPIMPVSTRPISLETVNVKNLPPGFTRISAVKRKLPNKTAEVEHWVFSDGLTHISLFLEPAAQPVESIRGQSKQGMINLAKRQVGTLQATVLGDAPWPAIEAIVMGLEARPEAAEK
jgi:sigma-E factor negative regulatory protein RseB